MLDKNGYLKLIDFGLSIVLRQGSTETKPAGTPIYFSPELIEKKPYNHSSDFYALGIVLYEMLSGIHPYLRGRGFKEPDLQAMKQNDLKFPSAKRVPHSALFKDFVSKLLDSNKETRLVKGVNGAQDIL